MSPSKMSKYANTTNKTVVRNDIDRPIVEEVYNSLGRQLNYFGLPGPRALDVLSWKEFIGRIDAVEHFRKSKMYLLETLVMNSLDKDLRLFEENVEDLINDEHPSQPRKLRQYDLINLDFEGPIFTSSKSSADKRIKCMEKLLQIQGKLKSSEILLLITLQAARASNAEFKRLCDEAKSSIPAGQLVSQCLAYAMKKNTQKHYLALGVPLWVYSFAQHHQYIPTCRAIVFYKGTSKVPMAHFAFTLKKPPRRLPTLVATEKYEEIPLCEIREVKDGVLRNLKLFDEVIGTESAK